MALSVCGWRMVGRCEGLGGVEEWAGRENLGWRYWSGQMSRGVGIGLSGAEWLF